MNPSQIQYREFDHKEAVARLTDVVSAVDSAESTGVQASCLVNVWTLGTYSAKSSPCAPLFLLDPFSEKALVARTTLRIGLGWISMACFVLPWSIAQSGVYLGATGVFGALLLANYTLRLLVSCGHLSAEVRNEFPSYAQIGRRAFGRTGYVIVWAALMCTAVTSCAAYLSFVSQALECLISSHLSATQSLQIAYLSFVSQALECLISSHFSATQCLLLVTGALVMVSWMRSVSLLAPSLCLGVATILFGLAVTLAQGKDGHTWTSVKNQEKWAWPGLPLLVANVVFLSFSHTSILSVEQSMLDRANFHRALNFSSVIAFCIYTAFGILACAAYAGEDDMTGNVLEQLSSGNIKQAVWILCAVYLFFTAVLCYLPLWDGLERALVSPAYFGNLCVEALRNLLRAVWIGLAAALAYFLSEFHLLVCLA
eukprot:g40634.t1